MQIAEGLAAAAKLGLVHRDIKPANILLENGVERVKITDFGLARTTDDASVSQSGTVAGTPMYMSPEQANGEQVDHRSDLFSLGSVLYVMCTGRPPFRAASTMAVIKRVCDETATPVQQVNPDIPDWLGDIVAKLHAKKPSERFQSAKDVVELLGQHLARIHEPTAQTPVAQTTSTLSPAPATTSVKSGAVRSAFRQMLPWLGAGGLVMGMLAVFLVLYSLHKPPEQTTVHLKADDVLKSLVGTWQVEFETTLPKSKMTHGIAGYTWVANEKLLRGYICYDDGSEPSSAAMLNPRRSATGFSAPRRTS
jgi:serine/threonine protein kinase